MNKNINYVKGYKLVFGYIGNLILLMGIIMLVPLLCLLFYHDEIKYALNFIIPSILSIGVGILLSLLVFKKPKGKLQKNQDAIIVVIGWIIYFIIGCIPYLLKKDGQTYTFTQSIFEVVSGFTTTGITITDVTIAPKIYLLYRSITLFFGGVGIIIALISLFKDNSGMALYNAEGHEDRLMSNLIKSTRTILIIYTTFVLCGFIAFVICKMDIFDALNHAISSVATGGFSTKDEAIGHYDSIAIEIITMILMLLGATNFLAHLYLIRGKFRNFFRYNEVKTMYIILFITIIICTIISTISLDTGFFHNLRYVSFHLISALTGTGFELRPIAEISVLYSNIFVVMLLFMAFGGNSGSTSGGIKSYRLGVIFKNVTWMMSDNMRPGSSLKKVRYIYRLDGKEYFDDKKLLNINSFILSYIFIIFLLAILFAIGSKNADFGKMIFEATSIVSTAGFSMGIVSIKASNFILWSSIIGMFLGRLEIFIVFICFIRIYKDSKRKVEHKVKNW